MASRASRNGFNVMVKPRGAACNLACAYCHYLSKQALGGGAGPIMDDALLEEFTRQYMEAQPVPEATFVWQGGEPTLMGLEFFRRAVRLQRRHRPAGMKVVNALQTNGTLLDDDWCHFLRHEGFLVGVSLDGPREVHDTYRRDPAGRPSFDRVMAGIERLREHGIRYNLLACVHAANAGRPLDTYRFLRDRAGGRHIQLIPVVVPVSGHAAGQDAVLDPVSVSGPAWGGFLTAVFDEWARHDLGRVSVQLFEAALAAWMGLRPGLCALEETCGRALVLERNGNVFACDHFVDPAHRLGNLHDTPLADLADSREQGCFGLDKRDGLPRVCRDCRYLFACHGGCPRNRLRRAEGGESGWNVLCQGYRRFFSHVDGPMRILAAGVAEGRSPADLALALALRLPHGPEGEPTRPVPRRRPGGTRHGPAQRFVRSRPRRPR